MQGASATVWGEHDSACEYGTRDPHAMAPPEKFADAAAVADTALVKSELVQYTQCLCP